MKGSVFPWPAAFRDDLVTYLRTLRWPSVGASLPSSASPPGSPSGVTWAELAVNFEVVTGKALPRAVSRQGASRPYGAPSGALLSDQSDLFHKVKTLSNACRSLARCFSTPVVAGKQSLHKIPHLAGKNVFRGLSQRPVMQSEAETHQRLKDCFDARVGGAVRSSIQDITALEAPPGQQPLALAFSRVTPLKWTPPVSEAPAPAPDTSVQASALHTLYKQGSRWHCRTCGCTASAQQKAAFATAPCHGDLAHVFKAEGPRSKQHKCLHCCVVATGQADLVRLQALPCPKLCRSSAPRPDPHGADSAAAPARPPVVKPPPELHHPVQCGAGWKCANCPLSCPTKGALARFKKARCLGDRAHSYEQPGPAASVAMLLLLPSSFRARLLTLVLVLREWKTLFSMSSRLSLMLMASFGVSVVGVPLSRTLCSVFAKPCATDLMRRLVLRRLKLHVQCMACLTARSCLKMS